MHKTKLKFFRLRRRITLQTTKLIYVFQLTESYPLFQANRSRGRGVAPAVEAWPPAAGVASPPPAAPHVAAGAARGKKAGSRGGRGSRGSGGKPGGVRGGAAAPPTTSDAATSTSPGSSTSFGSGFRSLME